VRERSVRRPRERRDDAGFDDVADGEGVLVAEDARRLPAGAFETRAQRGVVRDAATGERQRAGPPQRRVAPKRRMDGCERIDGKHQRVVARYGHLTRRAQVLQDEAPAALLVGRLVARRNRQRCIRSLPHVAVEVDLAAAERVAGRREDARPFHDRTVGADIELRRGRPAQQRCVHRSRYGGAAEVVSSGRMRAQPFRSSAGSRA